MSTPCLPLCAAVRDPSGLGGVPAPPRGIGTVSPLFGRGYEVNRAPAEAQRSGFGGKRRSCGMSDFSPFGAEMRDMEPATTRSGIKPWRRFRRYGRPHLPAHRAAARRFGGQPPAVRAALGPEMCGQFTGVLQNLSGACILASVSGYLFTSGVCRPQTADGCRLLSGI